MPVAPTSAVSNNVVPVTTNDQVSSSTAKPAATGFSSVDTFERVSAPESTNLPATVEDKVGRKMRYSKLMGITTAWENEPNELKKIIQIPLVPLYVIIDLVSAPLLPFINAYELFHNTGVDARRAWYGEG